jgi:chitin synthase
MADNRLTSPPPLFPAPSTSPSFSSSGPYGHPLEDDTNDAQPLLNHAVPHPAFNIQPMPPRPPVPYDPPVGGRVHFDDPYQGQGGNEEEERINLHYGAPPARVLRRNRTQKRVQ